MSYARRLMVAVAAVCLMAAFAAPTAGAAAGNNAKASASAAKAQKKAKKAKARAAVTKKRLHLKIRNNRKYIRGTRKLMRRLGGRLRDVISGGDKSIDDKINGIVAVVTPVLQQLGEGSLALKAGLETLAAATTAGFDEVKAGFDEVEAGFGEVEAALTDIGDFLGASEYGFGQSVVLEGGTTQNPQEGHFVVTPNVPDDVQQAQTQQTFQADVATPGPVIVAWGMRTNENDGDAPGHCRITVFNHDTGSVSSTTGGDFGIGFLDSPEGSAVTSEDPDNNTFPFGLKTDDSDGEADNTSNFVSSVNVSDEDVYSIAMSCVDTTPDPDDPNA